jgi:hypothetical protein
MTPNDLDALLSDPNATLSAGPSASDVKRASALSDRTGLEYLTCLALVDAGYDPYNGEE